MKDLLIHGARVRPVAVRRRTVILAIIVLLGFPAGYGARGALNSPPDRVDTALALFRRHCLPYADGVLVPPGPTLIRTNPLNLVPFWVEPQTHVALEMSPRECVITDAFDLFDEVERAELSLGFNRLVAQSLPGLSQEDGPFQQAWAETRTFVAYPSVDPRRWGVALSRFSDSGEHSETTLRVFVPPHPGLQSSVALLNSE